MANPKYTAPSVELTAFNCPNCGAFAHVGWASAYQHPLVATPGSHNTGVGGGALKDVNVATCSHCNGEMLWAGDKLVHSAADSLGPPPDENLPDHIWVDFEEARSVARRSPRGATALVRLCLQNLCIALGEPGKNINDDIGALVKKGLPAQVQKALDTVRVFGNSAVHPSQIGLKDDPETVAALMGLVNFISDQMIGQPKKLEALFGQLPPGTQAAIAKRDGKS